ncbi:fumarylacetoacetate hydrolase family protein [Streptomyces sp. NPDC091281]|uniref:fumarylacetoacetate hydrolase family protein n=1 Tax=Streptomyces sp. NPDC091281 TaxID=3365985 RepID=UPI00381E1DF6
MTHPPQEPPWGLATVTTAGRPGGRVAVAPVDAARAGGTFVVPDALRDLTGVMDVMERWDTYAEILRGLDPYDGERVTAVSVLSPLRYPRKVLCSGPNFRDHLAEMGESGLGEDWTAYFFLKPPTTTVIGPEDPVEIGGDPGDRVDWEGELAVVVGRGGRDIPVARAADHIAGYTVANDISLRGPHRRTTPAAPFVWDWLASKGADSSLPVGPLVVPAWQVPDPQDLRIRTHVNGERTQDGTTADMVLDIPTLVSQASALVTLEPGDLVVTGTPAGVGAARGTFLEPGDSVEVDIPGVGTLRNAVRLRQKGPTSWA